MVSSPSQNLSSLLRSLLIARLLVENSFSSMMDLVVIFFLIRDSLVLMDVVFKVDVALVLALAVASEASLESGLRLPLLTVLLTPLMTLTSTL